jgi:hypothetical protein
MLFNVDKFKVMHVGHANVKAEYRMEGAVLNGTVDKWDLGVIVQHNLKCSKNCAKAVNTANRDLGMTNRFFRHPSANIQVQSYKSLIRPHLDYCVQAWRTHLKKDIDILEKVQRWVTKMVFGMDKLSYKERLKKLKLTMLETILRGDLIEMFQIIVRFLQS